MRFEMTMRFRRDEEGMALITVILALTVLLILAVAAINYGLGSQRVYKRDQDWQSALSAAEARAAVPVCSHPLTAASSRALQVNHRTADGAGRLENVSFDCPSAKGMYLDIVLGTSAQSVFFTHCVRKIRRRPNDTGTRR